MSDQVAADCIWCEKCAEKVRVDIVFSNIEPKLVSGFCSLCSSILWSVTPKAFNAAKLNRCLHKTKRLGSWRLKPWQHKTLELFPRKENQ